MYRILQTLFRFCVLFCLLMSISIPQVAAADQIKPPQELTAQGAVLYDRTSGQFLFEQDGDRPLYPASITKVLTAIIALEQGNLNDRVKTSKLAREQEGNRIYLEYDEEQSLELLLYGLLLNSGNDAAVAIAEHIGGSVEQFAEMMNQKAREIGALNSHFVTPSGLHDDAHTTTAHDMALISSYAMNNETFRNIVATETLPWKGQVWESVLVNLNQMLFEYVGATGIKTGYTDQARQTITVSAKRGERELIAVLMGVENRPQIRAEATQLLDYGFDAFALQKVASKGEVLQTFDMNGTTIQAQLAEDLFRTRLVDSAPTFKPVVHIKVPPAPFAKGTVIGTVDFYEEGRWFHTADLLADQAVPIPLSTESRSVAENKYLLLFTLIAVLLFLPKRVVKLFKTRSFENT